MTTEDISPRYLDFDLWENLEALKALYEGQLAAVSTVGPALPFIAHAVDDAVPRLRRGGRLIYAGAGTSARIGVQDGVELTPTFNWPQSQLGFAMAGGENAFTQAIENAEDSSAGGAARIKELNVEANDVVIGLAASGNTPFTVAAIKAAKQAGALTIGIANNPGSQLLSLSDHGILVDTGEEVIAGSTRMKAATAQKVVLNLFSTMAMVRLGKVYRGLMVHMRATNEKLRRRSMHMVATITGADDAVVAEAVTEADGDIKLASLIACGASKAQAETLLKKHDSNLRFALAELAPKQSALKKSS
ncbi:MAG: N-acetylmuramic acid 6-phosphate etherase [Pseudomonadota bacterium]